MVEKTSVQWWEDFPRKFVSTDILLALSVPLSEKHPHLSKNHLYHLVAQVMRYIYFEFASYRCRTDNGQLQFIHILQHIIDNTAVFDYQHCGSDNIENLSRFNAVDEDIIEWMLSHAIGPLANPLSKPKNTASYGIVAKVITKVVTLSLFRNFYNFLVTQPTLNESQQTIVHELLSSLERWENRSMQVILPLKNNKVITKKVDFNLSLTGSAAENSNSESVNKENLAPSPMSSAKSPYNKMWSKMFS